MADSSVIQVPELPALGGLYAAALRNQALRSVHLAQASKSFPNVRYAVTGVTADPRKLEQLTAITRGAGRDEVPASMLHILSFPLSVALMSRKDFPTPLLGLVHLRNQVTLRHRVPADARLDFEVTVANPAGHRVGTQFEIHAKATISGQSEPVWEGVSTYLARGLKLGLPVVDSHRQDFDAPDANALWQLSGDTGKRWAAVSGDVNPIHINKVAAKALGLKTTIAHGMYLASRALESAKPAGLEAFTWDVEFATPTFIPGSVALKISDSGDFQGWAPRSGKPNFFGSVEPLN